MGRKIHVTGRKVGQAVSAEKEKGIKKGLGRGRG